MEQRITNWITQRTVYTTHAATMTEAVAEALDKGVDLTCAYIERTEIIGRTLVAARMVNCVLQGCTLTNCYATRCISVDCTWPAGALTACWLYDSATIKADIHKLLDNNPAFASHFRKLTPSKFVQMQEYPTYYTTHPSSRWFDSLASIRKEDKAPRALLYSLTAGWIQEWEAKRKGKP